MAYLNGNHWADDGLGGVNANTMFANSIVNAEEYYEISAYETNNKNSKISYNVKDGCFYLWESIGEEDETCWGFSNKEALINALKS